MADVRTVPWQFNRLAGSLDANGAVTLSEQAATNLWLGESPDSDMLGSLNRAAGITDPSQFVGFVSVCNLLAGTTNLDAARALSTIATP
jgi:hypothetical protein